MTRYNRHLYGENDRNAGHYALHAMGGRAFDSSALVGETLGSAAPERRGIILVLALVFAAGLYAGALLFSGRPSHTPEIVYCPVPGSPPIAAVPAECGKPGVTR
ncbi:hypothetical protein ACFVMC_26610 [Nocardia sp. NPDC127579]|uniref:hypothetical protein n=1 Tax=Nocardia sp. NPDC127579 TaxID=3345402 RepID=UPI003633E014